MKVVNIGESFEIFPDSVKTYDKLPAQCYIVAFSKMSGFSLIKHPNLEVVEKAYGTHEQRVAKIMRSFRREDLNKNMGVLLSSAKGAGKTLLARMLSIECIKQGMPVIIVDTYIPGIANYLASIEQECMVLFDEFDKTFGGVKQGEGSADAQTELLGLFDGTSVGKKLFCITCNEIGRISEFLVNRPGRFHYHFRFDAPNATEITEYLTDKLGSGEWEQKQIEEVVKFSKKVRLNFDCLRAIAFEIKGGEEFKECIKDLNIINIDLSSYNVTVHFKETNDVLTSKKVKLDMFSGDEEDYCYVYDRNQCDIGTLYATFSKAVYNSLSGEYRLIPDDSVNIVWDKSNFEEECKAFEDKTISYISIRLASHKDIHYLV